MVVIRLFIVFLIDWVFCELKRSNADVKVLNLKVEYAVNPVGVDITNPRLSWTISSDTRNVIQNGYEIIVRKDSTDGRVVWQTSSTTSNTFGIEYGGDKLEAASVYLWKVTVKTNVGTFESDVGSFETGLMNSKIGAWEGAEWIAKKAVTNPDVVNYTIEYDFHLIENAVGFIFSSDEKNFLMWQINVNPNYTESGTIPCFRPHRIREGDNSSVLANLPVNSVIPDTDEGRSAWYRMRIEVRNPEGSDDVVITTAIRPLNGTFVTVDENRSMGAGWSLKKIGIRENDAHEAAEFDNIVIWAGDNTVIYNETFDKVPQRYFWYGRVSNGVLQVRAQTFHGATNVVDYEHIFPLFRKVVSVGEGVRRARLYATARGYYEYSINGEKVGDVFLAPGYTDYFYTIMYQIYDVTNMLKVGANAVGAMVGMGWYSGPHASFGFNMYGSTQSVLGKLVIEYENGTRQVVVTDSTWKMHGGPIISASTYYGEDYNSTYECRGWNTPDYNDSEWKPVEIDTPVKESVDIIHQQGPPVRVVHRFENPVLTEPVPGKYTYDFGQNMAGIVSMKLKGAAGTVVTVRAAEMLNTNVSYQNPGEGSVKGGDGPPGSVYRANLRKNGISVVYYTLRGDPEGETYTPRFTFHGFRYVEITGLDAALPPANVTALALSSDNEQTSSFETSNAKVNKLYSNVIWSMRSNFVSIPTDCPNRDERLGWAGDAQIFSHTAMYLSNSALFYTKWLRDLRSHQMNERTSGTFKGRVCNVIPCVRTVYGYGNFWGDASVVVPWLVYKQFGDVRILGECMASMRAWVDFLNVEPRSVDFLRVDNAPDDSNFGDWCSVQGSPKDMTNTLGTAYVNKLLGKMADVVGLTDDAKKYKDMCASIMGAFNKKFRNSDGTLTANRQTPYAMLVYFGLATDDKDRLFLGQMLAKNVNDHGGKLTSGVIGIGYLTPALSQSLQAKTAFTLLEQEGYPSWIYSINQGATTTWESWNAYMQDSGFPHISSFNHYVFGSVGEWMFSGVLGIRLDDDQAGYREFLLDPQIGGTLTFARGYYDSICGRIESSWTWDQETGAYVYNCTVPANTRATVFVPADTPNKVTEGKEGNPAYNAEGVTYVGYNGDTKREVFELASGSYMFGSNIKPSSN